MRLTESSLNSLKNLPKWPYGFSSKARRFHLAELDRRKRQIITSTQCETKPGLKSKSLSGSYARVLLQGDANLAIINEIMAIHYAIFNDLR